MRWSDLPLSPSPRMLRQFAGLWLLVFGGLAAWHWTANNDARSALFFAAIALLIGSLGLAAPAMIRPIFVVWLTLAFPIGWVVSRVVLILLFACLITPVALVFRLWGRDLLQLRRPATRTTYWAPKPSPRNLASYFHQS